MATRTDKKKAPVDLKLRRKMLERWENEGGKVGNIGPKPEPKPSEENTRKSRSEGRPPKNK